MDIHVLVVCNSRHHSRNLVDLALNCRRLDPTIKISAVCEPGDSDYFRKHLDPTVTLLPADFTTVFGASQPSTSVSSVSLQQKLIAFAFSMNQKLSNTGFGRTLSHFLRESTIACMLREKKARLFFERRLKLARAIFDKLQPTHVFAFGDRHVDIEAQILRTARDRQIKIVIPYTTYSGYAGLLKVRQVEGTPKKWFPISLYRMRAAYQLKGQTREGYYYQHPIVSHALHSIGCLSLNPWCIGNGLSDYVCVDSEFTAQRYREEGVPDEKLRIVGDVSYDSFYTAYECRQSLRQELVQRWSLDLEKKIIVFALPQFAEQGLMKPEDHWREIHFLLEEVKKSGEEVVVSLHPRMNALEYKPLEEKYGIRISDRPLKDILPIADAFVAVNSSTVFWSVLCGIPSVVIDFYGLDSTLFKHLKSVTLVKERESLLRELEKSLTGDRPSFEEDWKQMSKTEVFDGKVTKRYLGLLQESMPQS